MIRQALRFNNLTVLAHVGKYFYCLCDCGTPTRKLASNVEAGRTTSCGGHGLSFRRRRIGAPVSYSGMHSRLWSKRGSASQFPCADGCGKQAAEWSYDNACDDEYEGTPTNALHGYGPFRYCEHMEHYQPRCKSCHTLKDNAARENANV